MITLWPETRDGALLLPDLGVLERAAERLDDGALVHHLTVDDGLRAERHEAEAQQADALSGLLDLADLDPGGADIDADEVFTFAHGYSRTAEISREIRAYKLWHPGLPTAKKRVATHPTRQGGALTQAGYSMTHRRPISRVKPETGVFLVPN